MRKKIIDEDLDFLEKIQETISPKYRFIESNNLNQALQNLQNQISNLVNTFKDIIFDNYLLTSKFLSESEKKDLSVKITELQKDFKNVLRAMTTVYKQLKTNQPKNGESFKKFVDKQSTEVLELYNNCIEEPINDNLSKLLQDMYFMFDMCFRAINTELQQYNNKHISNKIPLVNTFRQPETYKTTIDFIKVLKEVFDKGQEMFKNMQSYCN